MIGFRVVVNADTARPPLVALFLGVHIDATSYGELR